MLLFQGLGGLDGTAEVTALQNALLKLGKSVKVDGKVNDSTVAALWSALKGNIQNAKSIAATISGEATKAIGWFLDAMNWVDAKVKAIPLGLVTTEMVLNHWSDIVNYGSTACIGNETCLAVTKAIGDARSTTYSGVASAAGVLAKVVTLLGAPAGPTGSTSIPTPTPTPTLPFNRAAMWQQAMVNNASRFQAIETPPPPPSGQSQGLASMWWIWALVGLAGGVLLAKRAA